MSCQKQKSYGWKSPQLQQLSPIQNAHMFGDLPEHLSTPNCPAEQKMEPTEKDLNKTKIKISRISRLDWICLVNPLIWMPNGPTLFFVYWYFRKKSMITFCLKNTFHVVVVFLVSSRQNVVMVVSQVFPVLRLLTVSGAEVARSRELGFLYIQTLHRSEIGSFIWFKITIYRTWNNYNITFFQNPIKMKCPFTFLNKGSKGRQKKTKNKAKIMENQKFRGGKENSWTCGMCGILRNYFSRVWQKPSDCVS